MAWTFYTNTGQIKGVGTQGAQGLPGLQFFFNEEPPDPDLPIPAPLGSTINATTPLALSGVGASSTAARSDHAHQSPGGIASITGAFTLGNTGNETVVTSASIPANLMAAGTTFRVVFDGIISTVAVTGGTVTWRVRLGTNTLTGNIATSVNPASAVGISNIPIHGEFLVTVRTAGAGGTVIGNGFVAGNIAAGAAFVYTGSGTTATVALDTTATKLIELTAQWSAANASDTFTIHNASIEIVKM